jgi:uncharacterized membrane protein YdjX (TVP38/TMEM64 family)
MSILKQPTPKTRRHLILISSIILILILLIAADVIFRGPLTSLLTNKTEVIAFIKSLGPLGPLAFVFLSALSTIIAPIPGQVVGLIGGFLFGWWGVLWTLIATALGTFVVFALARRFGRPLVEKLIKKDSLAKFDFLTKEKGPFIFFLIFLLPGLPDDIVCYLAGLTKIPIKILMVLLLLGRLPAIIMTNFIGAGLGKSDLRPVLIATLITVIILAIIVVKREKILALIKKH